MDRITKDDRCLIKNIKTENIEFASNQASKTRLHTGEKAEFNVKWSFKVMYFKVNGKATRN